MAKTTRRDFMLHGATTAAGLGFMLNGKWTTSSLPSTS